jgi:NAD(P)-dependent dehydrogenase (short-subunit alcohol dehydrogenase family)
VVCAHGFIDTEQVLEKERTEDIQATFDVNTLSLFWLAQAFLPDLQTGFLILSSSAGLAPNGRYAAYSASKAAANAFVQAMARNREHLKFIAVAPGPTNTEMRERIAGDAAKMQSPDTITAVVTKIVTGTSEYRSGDIVLVKDGVCSTASQV